MYNITAKIQIEMKEQWYTSTGTEKERLLKFQKKYKTKSETTKKIINFFNPKSSYSNYRK
jgi:hypothetical protein